MCDKSVATLPSSKVCTKCGVDKPLNEYSPSEGCKYGRRPDCKSCRAKHIANKRANDPDFHERELAIKRDCYRNDSEYRSHSCAKGAARRAAKLGCEGSHDALDRQVVFDVHGEHCRYCGVSEEEHIEKTGSRLSLDHVVPLVNGGSNDASNLAPCCRSCNSAKRNKSLSQFLDEIGADPALERYIRFTCSLVPAIRASMEGGSEVDIESMSSTQRVDDSI